MPDTDRIRDAVIVAAIVTACGLAWLSRRLPNVLSRWWFWSALSGLLLVVVELTLGRP
jgi:uncharacterized BrkB/YihY/UPF0761 family membrane protein